MKPPTCRRYEKYACIKANDVSQYLTKGFEPFGNAFYHVKEKCCYQAIVRYHDSMPSDFPHLTRREQECLYYLLKGYSQKKIAEEMHCSLVNIKKLLSKLKEKFEVTTRHALIQEAMLIGIDRLR